MAENKTINLDETFEEVHSEFQKFNDDVHSDNPPQIKYNEPYITEFDNGRGYIEFVCNGSSDEYIDWKGTLRTFHCNIFIPSLKKEPARIDLHPPHGLHINSQGEHINIEEFDYPPLNATTGSYLTGYPGGWEKYLPHLYEHFSGTTM